MSRDTRTRSQRDELADAEIVSTLLRLSSRVRTKLTAVLEPLGMSWSKYEILDELVRCEEASYGDLARRLARHRTSIKATASALSRAGLVAMRNDTRHTQRIILHATKSGVIMHGRAEKLLERERNGNSNLRDRTMVFEVLRRLENEWIAKQ